MLGRGDPTLAAELLVQAPQVMLPVYTEARIDSAKRTEVLPAEYRADLAVLLYERAKADPELAVLSAMAHGRDADPQKSLEIAVAAMIASRFAIVGGRSRNASLTQRRPKTYWSESTFELT